MLHFKSLILLLLSSSFSIADVTTANKSCSCGFYDVHTKEVFTDAIIVYFNETDSLPNEFVAEDYEKKYEKDWNAIYRQGAAPANLHLNQSDSLQLFVQPSDNRHLVNGAGIRTARHDIQHGSFRTLIKSPSRTARGSAISMMWQYNDTETAEISVMNTNDASEAWVGTFISGEFTTRDLGVNFTSLMNDSSANRNYTAFEAPLRNGSIDPWNYVEYRIDWTDAFINFYIGGNLTRTVLHDDNKGMPSVPSPFYFKHWSTGNRFTMEGPPKEASKANVRWIRMFFNSSTTDEQARDNFEARCAISNACSINDFALRGSTPYTESATVQWKQAGSKNIKRKPALWISIICIAFSTILLVHAFVRRAPWCKQPKAKDHGQIPTSVKNAECNPFENPDYNLATQQHNPFDNKEYQAPSYNSSIPSSPVLSTRSPSDDGKQSTDDLTIERTDPSPHGSDWGGSTSDGTSRPTSLRFDSRGTTPGILSPTASQFDIPRQECHPALKDQFRFGNGKKLSRKDSERTIAVSQVPALGDKVPMETVTESALPAPRMRPQGTPPRERVDYLAGLVAMCAILVTVMHFGLSFVPAMVIPGAPRHYQAEYWVQQLVAPFILNQMWLGVFFTTSVRFLVASYLKEGNLQNIAKAAVRRTPRLMIPVASIALLQYFLIDCGATTYLRYIPSITWSTWPYVTRYQSFGHYVSEILELIYLIPNAVPQITYNYCTGVLWTIAVQLQGSWLVLCGVIVVYEIKTPWKRMCYYAFALVNHWYAQSWGSYLWLGLLLTDLDITFKYKQWLHGRPAAYYALISFCWICVAACFSANMIPNWVDFNFTIYEHNIHPDATTGEPLGNADHSGYPAYYVPRLNGLLFAGGMQAIVELSPAVQWVLSLPFLLVLFPHIFTIYLLHGLVFWSYGSWLMVFLAERAFGYGANVAIVGVTSYLVLGACLPIVTPIIEALGKDITALVWMSATEKSPPRRRTLFPFPEDLFTRREGLDVESRACVSASGKSSVSEKGKGKRKEVVREISQFDFS